MENGSKGGENSIQMIWAGNTKIKSLVWLLLDLALWSWWELILTISFLCWHFLASSSSPFILNVCWPSPAPPSLLKMYGPPPKKATNLQISSFALLPVSISCLLSQPNKDLLLGLLVCLKHVQRFLQNWGLRPSGETRETAQHCGHTTPSTSSACFPKNCTELPEGEILRKFYLGKLNSFGFFGVLSFSRRFSDIVAGKALGAGPCWKMRYI